MNRLATRLVLDLLRAENWKLRAAAYAAFEAMCRQRKAPDLEALQHAIDALGLALNFEDVGEED